MISLAVDIAPNVAILGRIQLRQRVDEVMKMNIQMHEKGSSIHCTYSVRKLCHRSIFSILWPMYSFITL